MAAKLNLDLTKIQPESDSMFSRVPAGTYTVVLAHSVFKDTKSGGAGITVGYMIEEGEHTGKMISDFINVQNANEKAVEIGMARLKKIMEVQKRKSFKLDTDEQLISSVPFKIEVTVEAGEYNDKPTENNRVKKIMAIDSTTAAGPSKTTTAKKAEAKEEAPAEELMPWDENYRG